MLVLKRHFKIFIFSIISCVRMQLEVIMKLLNGSKIKLEIPLLRHPMILDEDRLIFAASDGLIYVYDKKSGVLIKKINEGSPIIATPVLKDGYLYTADFLGKVKRYKI